MISAHTFYLPVIMASLKYYSQGSLIPFTKNNCMFLQVCISEFPIAERTVLSCFFSVLSFLVRKGCIALYFLVSGSLEFKYQNCSFVYQTKLLQDLPVVLPFHYSTQYFVGQDNCSIQLNILTEIQICNTVIDTLVDTHISERGMTLASTKPKPQQWQVR